MLKLECSNCYVVFKSKKTQRLCPKCKFAKATANWTEYQRRHNLRNVKGALSLP